MADWRYDIQYGPDGEANYAFVYDAEGALVSNLRTHHAKAVVDAMNHRAPSPSPRPAVQPGVVKALEWERGVVDWARPLPGMKYVACSTTPQGSWGWWLEGAPETRSVHPSEAEAKAAAQADFDRRILSQIDFAALAAPVSQEPVVKPVDYEKIDIPADIREFGERHKIPEFGNATYRNGYVDGYRFAVNCIASPQPLTKGEPSEAEVERPNWPAIYKDVSHAADRDGELVAVTRETLRLARAAIRSAQEKEAYNNFRAAEIEINRTLLAAKSKGGQADG